MQERQNTQAVTTDVVRDRIHGILSHGYEVSIDQLVWLYAREFGGGVEAPPTAEVVQDHVLALIDAGRVRDIVSAGPHGRPTYPTWRRVVTAGAVVVDASVADAVLESMKPGCRMSTCDVSSAFYYSTGYKLTDEAVNAVLSSLSHENEDGRRVSAAPDYTSWWVWHVEPGMGATYHVGSDAHACTVVAVSATGYKITTRDDKATRVDSNGMSDHQEYRYERDPAGEERVFYRDARGRYGNRAHGDGRMVLGVRHSFHDYSF